MKTRNLLTPSTDSEQTHSGPAKRLNSRSSPFHQVTKQPTRINFPDVEFQHRPAGQGNRCLLTSSPYRRLGGGGVI